jgi:hypothetical protein
LKKALKIFATNWVHLVGFYITTYLSIILFKTFGMEGYGNESWLKTLSLTLLMIPFLFFTYGTLIILGFYAALLLSDTVAFSVLKSKKRIRAILLIEWLLIIPTFISWAFEYNYWLWITLSISFLVTQHLREKKIKRIIVA